MIVSWNWLSQYLRLDMSVEDLTNRLSLTGLNHEATEEIDGDLAIDLEVTSNRSDCLGHLGIAREIAAVFGKPPLVVPDPNPPVGGPDVASLAAVENHEPDLCPRFTARLLTGVRVGPSPWWLVRRLKTLGQDSVNNVVDLTNYVLYERGQPLHAYDFDRLEGRRLIVRRASAGEKLHALDKTEYSLTPDMLVIADAQRPVALAGVMGGLATGIQHDTVNVLLESAAFHPLTVRKTARALGLSSASSFRFERPIDPEAVDWASRRCAELILEVAGGQLHPGVLDTRPQPIPPRPPVTLRLAQIERVLGITLDRDRVIGILEALGIPLCSQPEAEPLVFQPPSWRLDVDREIDLIEEVARIHGYEQIPEDRVVPMACSRRSPRERVESTVRETLTALGFDEAYTFSLVSERLIAPLQPDSIAVQPPLRTEHSSRSRENLLRPSLVPSLLQARRHNEAHGVTDADLFEIAHVFLPRSGHELPLELPRLAWVTGRSFLEAKGCVEALLRRLHIDAPLTATPVRRDLFAEGRAAVLTLEGDHLGFLGELSEAWRDRLDLRKVCRAVELELECLIRRSQTTAVYRPIPTTPSIERELSIMVPRDLEWARVQEAVREAGGPLLTAITFLDTFESEQLERYRGGLEGPIHSLHFGMTFQDPERTLTGAEVDEVVARIFRTCHERFRAEVAGPRPSWTST